MPPGYFQAFRMVGDSDELIAQKLCLVCHGLHRMFAVTPFGVHLEITFQSLGPMGLVDRIAAASVHVMNWRHISGDSAIIGGWSSHFWITLLM
jgi:hypothetical protein